MTFGKVIGGGLPVGAFGGRAEIMDLLAPTGPVYQAGTLSGNPVTTAAGLATLRHADGAVYERLSAVADTISATAEQALSGAGVPHVIQRAGTLFSVFFTEREVKNYDDARTQSTAGYAAFFHSMLDAGVYLPPSAFEAWFVSAALDDAALDRVAAALPGAARAAARAMSGEDVGATAGRSATDRPADRRPQSAAPPRRPSVGPRIAVTSPSGPSPTCESPSRSVRSTVATPTSASSCSAVGLG